MDEITNHITKDPVLRLPTPSVLAGVTYMGLEEPKTPLEGTIRHDWIQGAVFEPPTRACGTSRHVRFHHICIGETLPATTLNQERTSPSVGRVVLLP